MVERNFNDFIDKQVSKYTEFQKYEISFVGSVAFSFQDILIEVLKKQESYAREVY